jgi:predicted HTH transcriptional regulator
MRNNPQIFRSKKNLEVSSEKIKGMIQTGEGPRLEFKSSLRTNLHTNTIDKSIENAVLKTITAYLNTDGGTLIIGVSDSGEILGLEKDTFPSKDKLKLHLNNMIKDRIGSQFMMFIQYELFPIDDKHVLKIDCLPSTKRVFLKEGKEEDFFIRNGPSSIKLIGSSMIDYINHRFKEQ